MRFCKQPQGTPRPFKKLNRKLVFRFPCQIGRNQVRNLAFSLTSNNWVPTAATVWSSMRGSPEETLDVQVYQPFGPFQPGASIHSDFGVASWPVSLFPLCRKGTAPRSPFSSDGDRRAAIDFPDDSHVVERKTVPLPSLVSNFATVKVHWWSTSLYTKLKGRKKKTKKLNQMSLPTK